MATETTNYGLHQWDPEDSFLRTDFNEDFRKIDAAISEKLSVFSGTYVGTGKSGSTNPNTLTFPFVAKAVIIVAETTASLAFGTVLLYGQEISGGIGMTGSTNITLRLTLSWSKNTLTWYTSTGYAYAQLNEEGTTYRYLAIG